MASTINIYFSQFWRSRWFLRLYITISKSKIKVVADSVPDKSLLPSLQMAALSLCPHTVEEEFCFLPLLFSSVQSLSRVQLFATPWTAAHQSSLSFTIFQSLLKLVSIESVMISNHLILFRPLLLLPSVFPSIRVFSTESPLPIRRPKYWSFSFSNSSSNEYSELISFRIDWFDLLAVQGTLKSLL